MNIGTLVSGLALGYVLTMPAYASRPLDSPAPEFPSLASEERALSLEVLAGAVLSRLPHPHAAYVCRLDTSSKLCVAQLTLPQGRYVVGVKNGVGPSGNNVFLLSLFHLGSDQKAKPRPQNLIGVYDLNQGALLRGNLAEFDFHLGIILDMYTSQLTLPEECAPTDI